MVGGHEFGRARQARQRRRLGARSPLAAGGHFRMSLNDPQRTLTTLPEDLFYLFPYDRHNAHLSIAGKWGRARRVDQLVPVSRYVSDHRGPGPYFIP